MSSLAQRLASLSSDERKAYVETLTPAEQDFLIWHWPFWARAEQTLPPGDWIVWLILAGRGFGKTRTGAEIVREWAKSHSYVNLIGATTADVRDIMVNGESGVLAVCPKSERPRFIANRGCLEWPSGAISLLFSAEEPDRLRRKTAYEALGR